MTEEIENEITNNLMLLINPPKEATYINKIDAVNNVKDKIQSLFNSELDKAIKELRSEK